MNVIIAKTTTKITMPSTRIVRGAKLPLSLQVADITLLESIFTITVGELETIAPIQP